MKLVSAKYCLVRICVFLLLLGLLVFNLFDVLKNAFVYNIWLNSIILSCFFAGVFLVIQRIFVLNKEYTELISKEKLSGRLKLLSPIYRYLSNTQIISQSKLESLMASIERKVEDSSSFSKYLSGILIFLGLLGTFWGLSHTIGNVADIIDNLGIDDSDAASSFLKLKNSLKIPLSGMGIAFGCSLFGLASSLILGFLNINQKKVADDFLDKVEAYLFKDTISTASIDDGNYHGSVFSMALLEKTIEMIYAFQNQIKEVEMNRISVLSMQKEFSSKLSTLIDAISKHQNLIDILGQGQIELQKSAIVKKSSENVLQEIFKKLIEIENSLGALVQGTFVNREYVVENLGKEIRLVSKTLSSLMRDE